MVKKKHATVLDGTNYRKLAKIMTKLGYPMNYISARNNIVKIMTKFVNEYSKVNNLKIPQNKLKQIASSPLFQSGLSILINSNNDFKNKERK